MSQSEDYKYEDKVRQIIIIKQAIVVATAVPVLTIIAIVNQVPRRSLTYLFQIILARQCRCVAHDDCFRHKYLQILQSMNYARKRDIQNVQLGDVISLYGIPTVIAIHLSVEAQRIQ